MRKPATTKIYGVILAVIALLIFLHIIGPLKIVEHALQSLFTPILDTLTSSRSDLNDRYAPQLFSQASCRSLAETQDALTAKVRLLSDENDSLRKQLDFKNKQTGRLLVARVIGRDPNSPEQFTIINRGSNDGLSPGQPVLTDAGILVGKIAKADADLAYIRLISDNQSKIAATILNHDQSLGVVEGGFGISLRMSLIPRNETVLVGDQIVTSGLDPALPRGLLIGTVAVVENEAYQPFQDAILTPAADLAKLSLVSVIISP